MAEPKIHSHIEDELPEGHPLECFTREAPELVIQHRAEGCSRYGLPDEGRG